MIFATRSFGCTLRSALMTDLFFNCCCSEIPSDYRIWHVQKYVYNHVRYFRLEAFWDLYVWNGSRTPQLYSIGPDWYECCFVYENSVAYGEFWLQSKYRHSQLLPFCEYVFVPGVSCRAATWATWLHIVEEGLPCLCGLGGMFLFVLWMWHGRDLEF
jgi:hypothetical protein